MKHFDTIENPRVFAPVSKARDCQAKDPLTCRYHGSLMRMEKAIHENNLWDYFEARSEFLLSYDENKPVLQNPLPSDNVEGGDQHSASVSRGYGHFSILEDHLHNSSETGSPQELIYYASPQGQLELKRRLAGQYNSPYLKIQEDIEALRQSGEPFPMFDLNEEYIQQQLEEAETDFDAVTADPLKALEDKGLYTQAMQHYLVERSYEWLQQLPTDQQEAVSWLTSNGFRVLQYAERLNKASHGTQYDDRYGIRMALEGHVDETKILNRYPFDHDKAEAAITRAHNRYARNYSRKVKAAFKKAPRLEKPITVGRGTSVEELMSMVSGSKGKTPTQVMDELENGNHDGVQVSETADIRSIPKSASVNLWRALGFSNYPKDREQERREVMVLIKARTCPSPVNVSAWSSAEGEVFTNPNSDYVIRSGKRVGDHLFVVELEEQ